MSKELLDKLEKYRLEHNLTKFELCLKLKIPENYLYRWKKKGQVKGAYKRIIEDFLGKEE